MITSSCEPLNPVKVIIILSLSLTLPSYFMYLSHDKCTVRLVAYLNKLAHCFLYIHSEIELNNNDERKWQVHIKESSIVNFYTLLC